MFFAIIGKMNIQILYIITLIVKVATDTVKSLFLFKPLDSHILKNLFIKRVKKNKIKIIRYKFDNLFSLIFSSYEISLIIFISFGLTSSPFLKMILPAFSFIRTGFTWEEAFSRSCFDKFNEYETFISTNAFIIEVIFSVS